MISATTFIKNNFKGAFCLFESMVSMAHLCSEYVIYDLGSTDGTYEILKDIAKANSKFKIKRKEWSCIDASAFADIANDCVQACTGDTIIFHQADEIWHENLLKLTEEMLKNGKNDLSFWRYQLRENFQLIRQFPQRVHRIGAKDKFNFVDDGMNTDRCNEPELCTNFDGGWYVRWGDMFKSDPPCLPTWEMILDVSLIGAFRQNIIDRKSLHSPFWRDGMDMPNWNAEGIEGRIPFEMWEKIEGENPNWTKSTSPFKIPHVMKGLVGVEKYYLRDEILQALKTDRTREVVGL